tara:strand:+ start:111 stop:341 length:231 start_codon:yes stop_codon:yes gene_type:complete
MSQNINLQSLRDWVTLIVAVTATVAGVIFWVGSVHDPKFEEVEKEIQLLRDDIAQIRLNNNEILRIVGRLEGKLEN